MGNGFKEVAHLRTNKVLYDENYSGIDWNTNKEDKMALTEHSIHDEAMRKELDKDHRRELIADIDTIPERDDVETDWDRNK